MNEIAIVTAAGGYTRAYCVTERGLSARIGDFCVPGGEKLVVGTAIISGCDVI